MSNLNLPGGLTDNPPSTLSARQLFREWLNRDPKDPQRSNGEHEYTATDGTFMLWVGLYDFDYKRGYLFEIRSGDGGRHADWLFAWERFGGKDDFDVEWQNTPCDMFSDEARDLAHDAMRRLPDWCVGNLEADRDTKYRDGTQIQVL